MPITTWIHHIMISNSDKILKKMNNDSRLDPEYKQYANHVKDNLLFILDLNDNENESKSKI